MSRDLELTLIRHGETEWSAAGRHTSTTDLPLTPKGEEQAGSLAGRLDPAGYGLILSSPRLRARHTAELAGFTGPYAPQLDDDLVEWDYGDYEGRTSEEIRETVPDWTIWEHPAPGGETADQVRQRLLRAIARIRESGVERAICFGHGHALRALTLCWLGFDLALGNHFPLHTGTVSVLGTEKDDPAVLQWNAP
ncbi:histidine phosphatase family protein [Microlunatus speluncae]|uniref:histidine phosphatase family protein n=1 Tax=Microlunatus speluncae TaxID=2594267 RepID=UPI001266661D|nr:histidine phosphatase family protein [Microlunatus speluncae]